MVTNTARVDPETPTKQAAAQLDKMTLKSPVKQLVFDSLDDLDVLPDESAKNGDEESPIEDYRLRFVGDVDLDEKDEPLLKESRRRFVLFPIQYHEVSLRLGYLVFVCSALVVRSGKCTRRLRPRSGPPRKWICPRTK